MCGPLVCAILGPNATIKNRELWIYNILRILGYVFVGASLGMISFSLGAWLAYVAGSILLLFAILPKDLAIFSKTPLIFKNKVNSNTGCKRASFLGVLTSLLPCMSLTPAYTMAIGSGDYKFGALFMFGFGLGTLPIMLLAPSFGRTIKAVVPVKIGTFISRIFLFLAGVITIWRGI